MTALPVTPPADAPMVAVPAPTAVTRPFDETVATALFDDDHAKVDAELGGDALALSCTVWPTTSVALDGEILIDFTFGPPFAKDGSVGAMPGDRWSEQDSVSQTSASAPAVKIRVCMSISWCTSRMVQPASAAETLRR
jgi:hypothetical protein